MKRVILLVLFLCMASVAAGEVSTRVCLADGNTPVPPVDPNFPHVYPDIMVGTRLTIIVDSNVACTDVRKFEIINGIEPVYAMIVEPYLAGADCCGSVINDKPVICLYTGRAGI